MLFRCRRCATLSLLFLLLAPPIAGAVDPAPDLPAPSNELRLDAAVAMALRAHPDLARFVDDRRALAGRRVQAGLANNPEIGLELENFAGTGAYRDTESLEATLRLGLVWQRRARREARLGLADAQIDQLGGERTLARLDVVAETARRFIDVVESQALLVLAQRAAEYATQTLAAAQRRIASGAASSVERNRARIALERAQLEHEHQEHELGARWRRLAGQWGASEALFTTATADLLALPAEASFEALRTRLQRSPDYARFDIEARVRSAELALARAQAQTEPSLSAGVRRFSTQDDAAFVASMLWPLPLRDRQQGAIAEAQARHDRVQAERRAAAVRAETTLYEAVQELRHARTTVEALRDVLLPQADEALRLIRRGYANGRNSQIDLLEAQKTRLDLERELITNAADYHRTLAAIERMTALAVDSNASPAP